MFTSVIFHKSTKINAPPLVFLSKNEANGPKLWKTSRVLLSYWKYETWDPGSLGGTQDLRPHKWDLGRKTPIWSSGTNDPGLFK